jgi:hypothetical protein
MAFPELPTGSKRGCGRVGDKPGATFYLDPGAFTNTYSAFPVQTIFYECIASLATVDDSR